jgi:hypothetical protein
LLPFTVRVVNCSHGTGFGAIELIAGIMAGALAVGATSEIEAVCELPL